MIEITAVRVTGLTDEAAAARAREILPEARVRAADRCKMPADRIRSLAAGLLLRHGLIGQGEDPDRPVIRPEYGKPYLQGGPCFNLSHSGDYAVCVVSDREAGCDVEFRRKANLKIAERYFDPEEAADILSRTDPAEQQELFFRYWTLKESFMKAVGLGLRMPLDSFRIVPGEPVTVLHTVNDKTYGFREYTELPEHALSLCAEGGTPDAALRILTLEELL